MAGATPDALNAYLKLKATVDFHNVGDKLARRNTLVVRTTPYLGVPDEVALGWTGCLTCTLASTANAGPAATNAPSDFSLNFEELCGGGRCRLEASLGDIPRGVRGRVVLGWTGCLTCTLASAANVEPLVLGLANDGFDVVVETSIESDDDVDLVDNEVQKTATRRRPPPQIIWPGNATINQNSFDVRGRALPGSTLGIFVDGVEVGEAVEDVAQVLPDVEAVAAGAGDY